MAAQRSQSKLFTKLGQRLVKAHATHATAETTFSNFGDPPAGIDNGVARLVECKFDEYKEGDNKGQPYFYAAGVIVSPKEHGGVPCDGLRVSIMCPLHDTPNRTSRKTFEDHLGWVYNELRKLGVDTTQLDPADLESTAEALKQSAPFFRFRTWKGKATPQFPDPRTNTDFCGAIPDYEPADADDGVDDGTTAPAPASPRAAAPPAAAAKPATAAKPAPAASNGKPSTKPRPAPTKQPEPEPAGDYSDDGDLDSLAERAADDPAAQAQLKELAMAQGHAEEDVDAADSWADVVEMIKAGAPVEGGGAAEEFMPEVDGVYYYHPTDPKTKQPGKKRVEVQAVKVDADAGKCDLKDLSNPKQTWKGVAFDRLSAE